MLTVEQVHNLVQQKIAILSDRAWERFDREGGEFAEEGKSLCEFTRLHAMDELLHYRPSELTYPQLEEFYATALQAGGYEDMPFLPFDFSFLNTAVYVAPTGGLVPHQHPTSDIIGLEQFVRDIMDELSSDEIIWEDTRVTTDTVGALARGTRISGLTLAKIIEKMVYSYQLPAFTSFSQSKPLTYEVGEVLSGTVNFSWGIANPENVMNREDSGSITVSQDNVLTPSGTFNLYGTTGKALTTVSPYTKTTLGTLRVTLNGLNSKGAAMAPMFLDMNWLARIYYFNSIAATVSPDQVTSANSILVSSANNVTVSIIGSGYKNIWIPDIIAQTGINFIDPANGNIAIDFKSGTSLIVTNPQGLALTGKLYQTINKLGSTLTATIKTAS